MKKARLTFLAAIAIASAAFTGCEKEGCTDIHANNYNSDAGNDDSTCTYPIVNVTSAGNSGDISGEGGTATRTWTFTNNNSTAGWDMSIDATTGSFQLVLQDADGTVVLDKTLTAGRESQDAAGTTSSGTAGIWTATVTLTDFNGSGDYSFL